MRNNASTMSKKNLVLVSIVISILVLFGGLVSEFYSTTPYISLMASLLLIIILLSNVFYGGNILINPLTIFSFMYSGYAIGAFYYAFSNGDFGKFVSYLNLNRGEVEAYFVYAIIYVITCYIFFVWGFSLFYKKNVVIYPSETNAKYLFLNFYKPICFILIFIGLAYWVWMSYVLAGGIVQMLLYFQAFRHLIEDAGLSTLPYHLYYVGIFFWLIASVIKYRKISIFFIFFSFLGLIIGLSTGRITLAFTYIMAQMIFYYYYFPERRKKITLMLGLALFSGFIVYFLRILSNQYFMGVDLDLSDKSFIGTIIGDGNITDLQQLVIVFKTFNTSNILMGSSYFDTFRNTIGVQFGYEPHSIGLLIKELYIPSTSGAPTPGAIGEAYANFAFLGPAIMFCIGASFSYIYMKVATIKSPLLIMIYAIFLARFVFMYPKVDSTMLINFLWGAMPLIIIWIMLKYFFVLIRN